MHSALVTTDMVSEHFKVACDGYPSLKSVDIMNDGTAYGCFLRVFSASILSSYNMYSFMYHKFLSLS